MVTCPEGDKAMYSSYSTPIGTTWGSNLGKSPLLSISL
jgi:hypothetical protein